MFEQLSINLNLIRKQIVTPSLVVRYFMWDLKPELKSLLSMFKTWLILSW
ncbi:hypothetical protein [Paenibacillus sp. FSL L8-0638]